MFKYNFNTSSGLKWLLQNCEIDVGWPPFHSVLRAFFNNPRPGECSRFSRVVNLKNVLFPINAPSSS